MSADTIGWMSDLVAGTWRLHEWGRSADEVAAWVRAALDLGIDTFDLADIYGGYTTERALGAALATDAGLARRVKIVTKCNIRVPAPAAPANDAHVYDSSAAYIVRSVERSLTELGVERVDLLLLHRQDPLCDPDEIADAFTRLGESGKVGEFGLSNATPSHVSMLRSRVPLPLVTNQVEASLLCLDPFTDGTFDQALEHRTPPMAWSPLAGGGVLAGGADREARVQRELARVASEVDAPAEAVALAFLMRHPSGVRPITGTRDPERLARLAASRDVDLTRTQWFDLWRASTGAPIP